MRTLKIIFLSLVAGLAALSFSSAESQNNLVLIQAQDQPAVAAAAATTKAPVAPEIAGATEIETAKALQQMKAANVDILAKQEATLKALDELQKAAEQLRIYTKRS